MKLKTLVHANKPIFVKLAEAIDCFQLFKNIERETENCFLLESLGEEGRMSRYSLLGFNPQHVISARDTMVTIDGKAYAVENPYFSLRDLIPQDAIARNYAGGLVGYLGYDAVSYFEPSITLKKHPYFEQFMFGLYSDGIIFDKITGELIYFYYEKNRVSYVQSMMKKQQKKLSVAINDIQDTLSEVDHEEVVSTVKQEIMKGNTFQCEIGIKTEFTITGDCLLLYERLRIRNPSPFMYYIKFGGKKIIGASPELLFGLRNREMSTFPLAGTIKRGNTVEEDQKLARILLHDTKEIAEHTMLVDLHRNDIGRVARFGSVKVRSLMDIKRFSHVQHISSEIVGLLQYGEDMFSALAANFPAGTLTGSPKIESIKIIERLEKNPRGPYGGAVGHFGFNGDCTFAIPIRTFFISGSYGFTQAASGIVYDSKAEKEFDELQRKLAVMKEVLHV